MPDKNKFQKWRGTFTVKDFDFIVDQARFQPQTIKRLKDFFIEGKQNRHIDAPSRQALNASIKRFINTARNLGY